jgi:hypothetical protein
LGAALIFAHIVAGAQKRIVEREFFSDDDAPPATLQAMMKQAHAAVGGKYIGQVRLVPTPEGAPLHSIHAFSIVEVLKYSAGIRGVDDVFEIQLPGGVKEFADRIERQNVKGRGALLRDRLYVVFLRWNPGRPHAELVEMWANGSIYDITAGRVRSLEKTWRQFGDRDAASFLGEARKLK